MLYWRFQRTAERLTQKLLTLALARTGKVARVALRREIAEEAEAKPLTIVKTSKARVEPDLDDPERQQFSFSLGAVGTHDLFTHRAASMEGTRTVRGETVNGGLIFKGSVSRSDAAVISTILIGELELVTDYVRAQRAVCDTDNNRLSAKARAYIGNAITLASRPEGIGMLLDGVGERLVTALGNPAKAIAELAVIEVMEVTLVAFLLLSLSGIGAFGRPVDRIAA